MLDITLTDLQFCILALLMVIAAPWIIQGLITILAVLVAIVLTVVGLICAAIMTVVAGGVSAWRWFHNR